MIRSLILLGAVSVAIGDYRSGLAIDTISPAVLQRKLEPNERVLEGGRRFGPLETITVPPPGAKDEMGVAPAGPVQFASYPRPYGYYGYGGIYRPWYLRGYAPWYYRGYYPWYVNRLYYPWYARAYEPWYLYPQYSAGYAPSTSSYIAPGPYDGDVELLPAPTEPCYDGCYYW